ncbi:hypothetical protein Gogos_003798 [Gossypium gossypioides]|uniref:Uncharacterized protein n=1 Tax=Gossypium gossypioides TaxID=34282 RepID=A0A7J9CP00_GOSGO|nr:hypothetical protein [Gossypium gossypioides]
MVNRYPTILSPNTKSTRIKVKSRGRFSMRLQLKLFTFSQS